MRPGPATVSEIVLQSFDIEGGPRRLTEVIAEIALAEGWFTSKLVAQEKAETWSDPTMALLRKELGALQEMGRPCRIAFNSSSEILIQGACFAEPCDSDELKDRKARRSRASDYGRLLRHLSPEQFEVLCGKLISFLGVTNPTVTRRSADEGIDFFGRLNFESIFYPHDLNPTIQKQLAIWIVGQAKHYKSSSSGTPELRDLVGAVTLARAGAFGSLEPPFDGLSIRVVDPVFAVFITTGPISSNGWRLLSRSGIVGMDGEMVAAFLADRGVGVSNGKLSNRGFRNWLNS